MERKGRKLIAINCSGYAHCQYHCCHLPLPPGPVFKPLKIGNHYIVQLLPAMVAKGKGAVINIASIGSYFPGPYLAEYIATKHYMHSFTEV